MARLAAVSGVILFASSLKKLNGHVVTSTTRKLAEPEKAGVKGRWHDNRHTSVTELAESGAGDEVIMSIAGHVSRAMLSRYFHVRIEAKRHTRRAADEKRQSELERLQRAAAASRMLLVQ